MEKSYIRFLMYDYNLTYRGVLSLKHRMKLQSYQTVYEECKYRDKLKHDLFMALRGREPRELKEMFMHTKYPNSSAISFVNYLYSQKDKGIVSDSAKNRYIIALEILKRKEDELKC